MNPYADTLTVIDTDGARRTTPPAGAQLESPTPPPVRGGPVIAMLTARSGGAILRAGPSSLKGAAHR